MIMKFLIPNLTPITNVDEPVNSFVYVSADPEAGIRELSNEEWTRFENNEKTKVISAGELASALPRVRQFDPSVGAEQKRRTMIAIVLSLFSIIAYIWVRFGNLRYGLAAIVALIHDVDYYTWRSYSLCLYREYRNRAFPADR